MWTKFILGDEVKIPICPTWTEPNGLEWIPVTTTSQLPDRRHFKNVVKDQFYRSPSLAPTCAKDLTSPLKAASEFLLPVLRFILKPTNWNLKFNRKIETTEEELILLILFECALCSYGQKFQTMGGVIRRVFVPENPSEKPLTTAQQVSSVRKTLFSELGVKANWPCGKRIVELRSHIRIFEHTAGTLRGYPAARVSGNIQPLVNVFNAVSKGTVTGSHGWSGHTVWPGIGPAVERMKINNISLCSVRYCEKLLLQRESSDFMKEIETESFTPVCGDRAYTTLERLAECTKRSVPYVGIVKQSCLTKVKDDQPLFSIGESDNFQKRMFCYKLKDSDVFLTCFYDQPGKPPVCFLSNFHTGQPSQNLTKRPQISAIYARLMHTKDTVEDTKSCRNLPFESAVRIFELMTGYLLVNARTAYCLANGLDMATYKMDNFYQDLFREQFTAVDPVSTINIETKVLDTVRVCNWGGCLKRTKEPCANSGCKNMACAKLHSHLVCVDCTNKHLNVLTKGLDLGSHYQPWLNIKKDNITVNAKCCYVPSSVMCKRRTRKLCSVVGCEKAVCDLHRSKLCADCCFNTSSARHYPYM